MFDYVRCRYPLPHHQHATFQTKDLMRLVAPDDWLDGLMDRYEITRSGRLRRQMKKYQLVRTPKQSPGLYLKATKAWWVSVPDAHGDVVIYTADGTPGTRGYRWIEFRIRFTDGRVHRVQDRSRARTARPGRTTRGGSRSPRQT